MTLASLFAFAGAMLVLAALPGTSVLTVVARSVAGGFRHGAAAAAGVVLGDFVYILLALGGLHALVARFGDVLSWVRVGCGLYLVWLGWTMARASSPGIPVEQEGTGSCWSSLVAGLVLTLADQKAILFYLGFFPAFFDVPALGAGEIAVIVAVTAVCVGGVKLVYAALAGRAAAWLSSGRAAWLTRGCGAMLAVVGLWLIISR
ncbi:MAG TPA: LysE family translocator [Kiritimatiellia bacterium]|nr:LysE family translocator [Kiritimatiellia bacterium]HMP33150.1 LysE family translocator [Kiritimatiellia bacterium]